MQLFFLTVENPGYGTLDAQETRHCVRVLRHQVGDLIHAIDGKGQMYECKILNTYKDATELEILRTHKDWGEHGRSLRLAISPLRLKDRFEWMIEKAVELGVTEIIPLQCQRTDPHKSRFKPVRLETLMLAALKQCKRSRLPVLHPIQGFSNWISTPTEGAGYIAWCEADIQFSTKQVTIRASNSLTLLIGPEGDFTESEVSLAQQSGFQSVLLGEQRLRSETAALFALSQVKSCWAY